MKIGRKTKYRTEHCEIVFNVLADGGSIAEAAATIGISKDTLYQWRKSRKAFSDAIGLGLTAGEAEWWKQIRLAAQGKTEGLNYKFCSFLMRNQYKSFITDTEALLADKVEQLEQLIEELTSGNDKHTH